MTFTDFEADAREAKAKAIVDVLLMHLVKVGIDPRHVRNDTLALCAREAHVPAPSPTTCNLVRDLAARRLAAMAREATVDDPFADLAEAGA